MMRPMLVAAWSCAMTLLGAYVGAVGTLEPEALSGEEPFGGIKYERVEPINVPVIIGGEMRGYLVAQFVYTADADRLKGLAVPPGVFLVDEAFRRLYGDTTLDPGRLKRLDLAALTAEIRANVNRRLQADIVKEVLVDQLAYYSKDDIKRS